MKFLSNRKRKGFTRHNAGFTLIELMVVIAIIGILASIITVSLQTSRAKGRDAKRVADIRTIQLALEEFYNDNGYYPGESLYSQTGSIAPTYIPSVPYDPTNNTTQYLYAAFKSGGGGNCTVGASTLEAVKYHLGAVMESNSNNNPALNQDVDAAAQGATSCTGSSADFNGNANNCSGTTAIVGPENCYDQTN